MSLEERPLLRLVAAVAGMLLGCVLAMTFLDLGHGLKFLILGVALVGHTSVLLLGSFILDQRRLATQKRKARRFKRFPQT